MIIRFCSSWTNGQVFNCCVNGYLHIQFLKRLPVFFTECYLVYFLTSTLVTQDVKWNYPSLMAGAFEHLLMYLLVIFMAPFCIYYQMHMMWVQVHICHGIEVRGQLHGLGSLLLLGPGLNRLSGLHGMCFYLLSPLFSPFMDTSVRYFFIYFPCFLIRFLNDKVTLFYGAGNWTQRLTHARQVFYHWATPSALIVSFESLPCIENRCF